MTAPREWDYLKTVDVELCDEAVEVGATDVEALGGGGLVAALALDGFADEPTLERVDGPFERGLVLGGLARGRRRRHAAQHLLWQELDAETRARGEHDETLDQVFELAYVARPVV